MNAEMAWQQHNMNKNVQPGARPANVPMRQKNLAKKVHYAITHYTVYIKMRFSIYQPLLDHAHNVHLRGQDCVMERMI